MQRFSRKKQLGREDTVGDQFGYSLKSNLQAHTHEWGPVRPNCFCAREADI